MQCVRPILLSGTCKKEDGLKHAELLSLLVCAINVAFTNIAGSPAARIVSIASDGETQRGCALTLLTMNRRLPEGSNIYELLAPLQFMNLLTRE
jgi:hypothetical protein